MSILNAIKFIQGGLGCRGGVPMGSQGGFPWDPRMGCHGIPGWALGDLGALGPLGHSGPLGPLAFGTYWAVAIDPWRYIGPQSPYLWLCMSPGRRTLI